MCELLFDKGTRHTFLTNQFLEIRLTCRRSLRGRQTVLGRTLVGVFEYGFDIGESMLEGVVGRGGVGEHRGELGFASRESFDFVSV